MGTCTWKAAGTCEGKGHCTQIQDNPHVTLEQKRDKCKHSMEDGCTWFEGGLIERIQQNTDAIHHGTCAGKSHYLDNDVMNEALCKDINTYWEPEYVEEDCKEAGCTWTPSGSGSLLTQTWVK